MNIRLQNIANGATPKTQARSVTAENKPVVLVLADSNGQHLNPNLLHEDKKVVIVQEVYTLEKVIEKLPKHKNVSDIVMLVGINNIKRQNATISETVAQFDRVQKHYPNAKIHVGSVAPSCEKFIFYNAELENLAVRRNAPFISALPILKVTPHGLQPKQNTLNGIHFTKSGIKLFANEVKRSLYECDRDVYRPQRHSTGIPTFHPPGYNEPTLPFIPSENRMPVAYQNELRRFFNIAFSALPALSLL